MFSGFLMRSVITTAGCQSLLASVVFILSIINNLKLHLTKDNETRLYHFSPRQKKKVLNDVQTRYSNYLS